MQMFFFWNIYDNIIKNMEILPLPIDNFQYIDTLQQPSVKHITISK